MIVTGQLHNDLGADAAVRQLRDKPPPARMAGGSVETGGVIQVAHELAQSVRGNR